MAKARAESQAIVTPLRYCSSSANLCDYYCINMAVASSPAGFAPTMDPASACALSNTLKIVATTCAIPKKLSKAMLHQDFGLFIVILVH